MLGVESKDNKISGKFSVEFCQQLQNAVNKRKKYDFKFENGDGIWFTSDLHFFHKNILKYCGRPFSDVEGMNDGLVKNWNSVVLGEDIVFILGDVGLGSRKKIIEFLKQLNGRKVLVIGNHDHEYLGHEDFEEVFECILYQSYILIGEQKIYLNHFPLLCFDGADKECNPTWQLFGHVHSKEGNMDGNEKERLAYCYPTQYDVGVDNNDYFPISFDEVKKKIENRINVDRKEQRD